MHDVLYVLPQSTEDRLFENSAPLGAVNALVATQDDGSGALGRQLTKYGVRVLGLGSGSLASQAMQLRRLLNRYRPGIVELHGFRPSLLAGVARMGIGPAPAVVSVRHHNLSHHLRRRRKAVAADFFAAASSTSVIAVSCAVRDTLLAEGVVARKIRVIPNVSPVVETDRLQASRSVQRSDASLRLLAVGRLEWDKNYEGLLRAIAQSLSLDRRISLVVAGTGHKAYARQLERLAEEVLPRVSVQWLGWHDDIGQLMLSSDILVHNSRDESFGLAVLEAIRHRLPVVSTFAGGLRELSGELYPQCAPEATADFSRILTSAAEDLDDWRNRAVVAESDFRSRYIPQAAKDMRLSLYADLA